MTPTTVILLLALGALMGAVMIELLRVDPLRRDLEAARKAAWEKERRQARDRFDRAKYVHVGTPYIREAGTRPGLRSVNGERLYSSEWLNG